MEGSEDHLIHCFKLEGPIPTGQELLRSAQLSETQALANLLEEIDLEEDVNNDFIDDEPLEFMDV
jgi:hypothetical protein